MKATNRPTWWGYAVYAGIIVGVLYPLLIIVDGGVGQALFHLWPLTTLLLTRPTSLIQDPGKGFIASLAVLGAVLLSHILLVQHLHGYATFGFSILFTPLAACILVGTVLIARKAARKVTPSFVIGYDFA